MVKIRDDEICPCGSGKLFGECHGPKTRGNRPIKITREVQLRTIAEPDPGTRSVFENAGESSVLFRGYASDVALVCGKCGAHLVEGLREGQIRAVVIKCNGCQAFNEIP